MPALLDADPRGLRRRPGADQGPRGGASTTPARACAASATSTSWPRTPQAAQAALLAAGFVEVGEAGRYEDIHHLRALWWPGLPLVVEIHDRPKWPDGLTGPSTEELLAAAVPARLGVDGIGALPPAEHALLLAAHAWAHEPLGRLGQLVDVAATLRRTDGRGRGAGAPLGLPAHVAGHASRRARRRRGRGSLARRRPVGPPAAAPCASGRCSRCISRGRRAAVGGRAGRRPAGPAPPPRTRPGAPSSRDRARRLQGARQQGRARPRAARGRGLTALSGGRASAAAAAFGGAAGLREVDHVVPDHLHQLGAVRHLAPERLVEAEDLLDVAIEQPGRLAHGAGAGCALRRRSPPG